MKQPTLLARLAAITTPKIHCRMIQSSVSSTAIPCVVLACVVCDRTVVASGLSAGVGCWSSPCFGRGTVRCWRGGRAVGFLGCFPLLQEPDLFFHLLTGLEGYDELGGNVDPRAG